MIKKESRNNIYTYKKRSNFNIGVILFGVILIYLLVTIIAYLTANHVTVYEVQEGSILKDNSYSGVILREEVVIKSESSGYINFFATEGTKVGKLTNVYSLSNEKLVFNESKTEEEGSITFSSEDQNAAVLKSQIFVDNYREENYEDTYQYKDSIENIISSNSTQSRQAQLDIMIEDGKSGIKVHTAADDGVIAYYTDGYENLKLEKITKETLSRSNYQKVETSNNSQIGKNDSIYKLITNEDWSLVIELDDDMAEQLAENRSVRLRFKKDNETVRAGFRIETINDMKLGVLTFDHSMVRYASERFLDIELILEDESGLKIPKSAVVQKEFFLIPADYITQGGNSQASGVLVKTKNDSMEFKEVTIYYKDQETDMIYIELSSLKENSVIIKPDSAETYTISQKANLSGVYNINKGYAVFRRINILCESDEYYIVESGTSYGLTNYDHIALDGKSIKENDVVF